MMDEHDRLAREALGDRARALLGPSYGRVVGRVAGALDVAVTEERERCVGPTVARLLSEASSLDEQAECFTRAVRSWPDDKPGVAVIVFRADEHRFAAAVLRRIADDLTNPTAHGPASALRAESHGVTP